ncbi:hypothetical protein [Mycolicibacterium sarraceniae]|nr:hypothetical protein [Mycolicibacterium sarraceniae]
MPAIGFFRSAPAASPVIVQVAREQLGWIVIHVIAEDRPTTSWCT